jgi:hypothetical protein
VRFARVACRIVSLTASSFATFLLQCCGICKAMMHGMSIPFPSTTASSAVSRSCLAAGDWWGS